MLCIGLFVAGIMSWWLGSDALVGGIIGISIYVFFIEFIGFRRDD